MLDTIVFLLLVAYFGYNFYHLVNAGSVDFWVGVKIMLFQGIIDLFLFIKSKF